MDQARDAIYAHILELIGPDLTPMDNEYNIIITKYKRYLRSKIAPAQVTGDEK